MLSKTQYQWFTVCLHYNEPWEELLGKAVKPFVDVVLQTGVADSFYFVRSWERGPHLRLNFKGNAEVFENVLKPNLEEHFLQYFESMPSQLKQPVYSVSFPENFKWQPNNTIRYIDHYPLYHRFGSQIGWEISEKFFAASSTISLHLTRAKSTNWTYSEMLSSAIKLHLSLAYASGMSIVEASRFFKLLYNDWESRQDQKNGVQSLNPNANTQSSFHRIFQAQRSDVVAYHSAIWELFRNYSRVESKPFVNWFHEITNVNLELEMAYEIGRLKPIPGYITENISTETAKNKNLWCFLAEYILLTNNKLGIHNKHEGYLLYVLVNSLTKIVPIPSTQYMAAV